MPWIEVARTSDIPSGSARVVFVSGKEIALFHVHDRYYALADSCPHAGSSLAAGKIESGYVKCRSHGLRFHLATGNCRNSSSLSAESHAICVQGSSVQVYLSEGPNPFPQETESSPGSSA